MKRYLLLCISLFPLALRAADTVTVAAAANLTFVLTPLDAAFEKANPGVKVTVTTGASGSLFAQISHGAPFDVFLSADVAFAQKVVAAGFAAPTPAKTFVRGRLVLWTASDSIPVADIAETVRSPLVTKLAIAEPKTAPYGAAAKQALAALGLTDIAQPKLVVGENISQTLQFVSTGNAQAGFVALSLVTAPAGRAKGHYLVVPQKDYAPLDQAGVITKVGAGNKAAAKYFEFLSSPVAEAIFEAYGYEIPLRD